MHQCVHPKRRHKISHWMVWKRKRRPSPEQQPHGKHGSQKGYLVEIVRLNYTFKNDAKVSVLFYPLLFAAFLKVPRPRPWERRWLWSIDTVEWYWRENRSTWRKTCISATLSTTNPTWAGLESNLALNNERPMTDNTTCIAVKLKVK
jgi:hypothetical protein